MPFGIFHVILTATKRKTDNSYCLYFIPEGNEGLERFE